jgi:hypothetical protein
LVADIGGRTTLGVFEEEVMERIFGPKIDDVTGEWRKLNQISLMIYTPHPLLCG